MAICELMCWGILLRNLERKNERHHDFVALQNLSVDPYCLSPIIPIIKEWRSNRFYFWLPSGIHLCS